MARLTARVRSHTMSSATNASGRTTDTAAPSTQWWALASGLVDGEVTRRREQYGSNELDQEQHEPCWRAFLRQYRDLLQLVLLGASIVALLIGELSTAAVVFAITLFNAFLALSQESKAERGLAALRDMLRPEAMVRRAGGQKTLPAEELVPGDVVLVDHGDRVPADGWLLDVVSLETDEASLTGESTPVLKHVEAVDADAALADRIDMVFANTTVTRGSGSFVVTATGMSTQVGHVAGMLRATREQKTPLVRQINQLTRLILVLAGLAFAGIVIILRVREGDSWPDLFNVGVALAIGAIPRCPARRRDRGAGPRDRAHGQAQRDREDAPVGRGPGLGVRDLHRQDGHAHGRPDDRSRAGPGRRQSVHGERRRLRHRGSDQAGRRHERGARLDPGADGVVLGRRGDRR